MHNIQDTGIFANDTPNSAPLRLTGGGNTSFECQEDVPSNSPQCGLIDEGVDVYHDSNENDLISFVNQENSMSEQDIRDVLFEAGYSFDEINNILAAKVEAETNSANSVSI